ncbi:aspartic peptidase domain-containing protein [Xylariales sp. PMI_506]|nr:aspartic peptidase domain-containing protein [Xylariales sp. PMI_506]
MKTGQFSALFTMSVSSATAAGVIPISIQHTGRSIMPLQRRGETYTETITNNISYGGYFASISVGTPSQSQDVILDTGSSDTWLLSSSSSLCSTSDATTTTSGSGSGSGSSPGGFPGKRYHKRASSSCVSTYDYSSSSTFSNLSIEFDIEYVDGSTVSGYYFEDDLTIAGATVDSLQMGLADTSDIEYGIMGIGFTADESASTLYPNIIDEFYSQGLIGAKAYSLYLADRNQDDLSSSTGTILLGGVDSDKYTGDLIAVPIIKDSSVNNYTSFLVTLSSVAAVYSNGTVADNYTSDAEAVILDSGTTLTYLPEDMAQSIMDTFDATYDSSLGYATCSCSLADDSDITLEFQFGGSGGPVIVIDLSQIVLQTGSSVGNGPGSDGQSSSDNCVFGISMSSSTYLLGDTFLRSAYVVYDLDNKEVALAQSNINSTTSSVTAITKGNSIPGVSSTATAVIASSSSSSHSGSVEKESIALRIVVAPCMSLVLGVVIGAFLLC